MGRIFFGQMRFLLWKGLNKVSIFLIVASGVVVLFSLLSLWWI